MQGAQRQTNDPCPQITLKVLQLVGIDLKLLAGTPFTSAVENFSALQFEVASCGYQVTAIAGKALVAGDFYIVGGE